MTPDNLQKIMNDTQRALENDPEISTALLVSQEELMNIVVAAWVNKTFSDNMIGGSTVSFMKHIANIAFVIGYRQGRMARAAKKESLSA